MVKRLEKKIALVTGASKGIGAAIALQLASEGATVVVNYSSSEKQANEVVEQIVKKGGRAVALKANVSDQKQIEHLFAEIKRALGKLDILVNNAGIYEFAPLEKITKEHFNKMFDLNVLGLLFVTQEALKLFGSEGGSIINISSQASLVPPPNTAVYSATKAAVDAITFSLSKELGGRKIRVNAINPSMVETEGVISAGINKSEFRDTVESRTSLGRIGKPQDIAPAVAFLASDEASWITGIALAINGGFN